MLHVEWPETPPFYLLNIFDALCDGLEGHFLGIRRGVELHEEEVTFFYYVYKRLKKIVFTFLTFFIFIWTFFYIYSFVASGGRCELRITPWLLHHGVQSGHNSCKTSDKGMHCVWLIDDSTCTWFPITTITSFLITRLVTQPSAGQVLYSLLT